MGLVGVTGVDSEVDQRRRLAGSIGAGRDAARRATGVGESAGPGPASWGRSRPRRRRAAAAGGRSGPSSSATAATRACGRSRRSIAASYKGSGRTAPASAIARRRIACGSLPARELVEERLHPRRGRARRRRREPRRGARRPVVRAPRRRRPAAGERRPCGYPARSVIDAGSSIRAGDRQPIARPDQIDARIRHDALLVRYVGPLLPGARDQRRGDQVLDVGHAINLTPGARSRNPQSS